jgi:hypothetical protein
MPPFKATKPRLQTRFCILARNLHLYGELFVSPFVALFALSVFVLVHSPEFRAPRFLLAAEIGSKHQNTGCYRDLSGRSRVGALRSFLEQTGVKGEIGFIRDAPKKHRLMFPVSVHGRESGFDIKRARCITISIYI